MDYSKKTRKDLLELCKERGLRGCSTKNKDGLVALLSESTVNEVVNEGVNECVKKRKKPQVAISFDATLPLNKIINGDSATVLKTLPEKSVDLTITSPPYDNIREYKGYSLNMSEIIKELYRVTKDGGVVVWVVGDATENGSETGTSFRQALEFMGTGFKLHDTMIYEKNTSSFPAKRLGTRYTQIFEYMFVFCKGSVKTAHLICDKPNKWAGHTNWGKNTCRGKDGELKETSDIKPVPDFSPRNNIWRYNVGKGFNSSDEESHQHPAIFPEKLAEDHILSWSNEGDIVLDPFSGSGTTAKMAKKNGRTYIGIEISSEYCSLAEQILEKY
jgi:site-specific DNA-methyltransferase (adenine-specific)